MAERSEQPQKWREERWQHEGAYLIDALFEEGELVNHVADSRSVVSADGTAKAHPIGAGLTLDRSELERLLLKSVPQSPGGCWLRLNPVDGKGIADSHVTAFRFTLIEFDFVPLELQLTLLAKLPMPIAAVLTSGGKSVHAWVLVGRVSLHEYQADVRRLHQLIGRFGVDPQNKNPSRLSRMPGACRTIGAVGDGRQRLLYLNPNPVSAPVFP